MVLSLTVQLRKLCLQSTKRSRSVNCYRGHRKMPWKQEHPQKQWLPKKLQLLWIQQMTLKHLQMLLLRPRNPPKPIPAARSVRYIPLLWKMVRSRKSLSSTMKVVSRNLLLTWTKVRSLYTKTFCILRVRRIMCTWKYPFSTMILITRAYSAL